jgi:putative sigma-54 modulation protein
MQLNLTGHHVEITDALRKYVDEKFERVQRHFDKVTNTHVILSVDNVRHKAEATVNMSGNNIFAEHIEEDMYAAIDGLIDKLDRQVKKHKEKMKDHHKA